MSYKHFNKFNSKCTSSCKPNYKFYKRKKFEKIGFLLLGTGIGFILSFILFEYSLLIGLLLCIVGIFLICK